jgi:hypothetical protein
MLLATVAAVVLIVVVGGGTLHSKVWPHIRQIWYDHD